MELRHNNIRIEDLSKKTLVKMLKDMFVYVKKLESDLKKLKDGTTDKNTI
jgi:hypothetical protein